MVMMTHLQVCVCVCVCVCTQIMVKPNVEGFDEAVDFDAEDLRKVFKVRVCVCVCVCVSDTYSHAQKSTHADMKACPVAGAMAT